MKASISRLLLVALIAILYCGCSPKISQRDIRKQLDNAYVSIEEGHYKEAASIYKSVLRTDIKNKEALLNIAYAYNRLGAYSKALNFYKKINSLYPYELKAVLGASDCLRGLHKDEEAVANLEKALPAFSNRPQIYLELAGYLIRFKDFKKAERLLKKAIGKFPDNERIYISMSIVKAYRNKMLESLSYAKKAEAINPHNRDVISLMKVLERIKAKPVLDYWEYSESENKEFDSIMKDLMSDPSGVLKR